MKFLKFLKKHLFLTIATVIFLIIAIVGIVVVKKLFFTDNGNKYGNRLEDIEKYEINGDQSSRLVNGLKENPDVLEASYTLTGRRVDIIIKLKDGIPVDNARGLAGTVLDYFDADQKKYYDFEVMISCENQENAAYPIAGYKHKSQDGFKW